MNSENRAGSDSQTSVLVDNKRLKVVIAHGELEGNSALLVNFPLGCMSLIIMCDYGVGYRQITAVALKVAYILLNELKNT